MKITKIEHFESLAHTCQICLLYDKIAQSWGKFWAMESLNWQLFISVFPSFTCNFYALLFCCTNGTKCSYVKISVFFLPLKT